MVQNEILPTVAIVIKQQRVILEIHSLREWFFSNFIGKERLLFHLCDQFWVISLTISRQAAATEPLDSQRQTCRDNVTL